VGGETVNPSEVIEVLKNAFGREQGLALEFSESGESFIKAVVEIVIRRQDETDAKLDRIASLLEKRLDSTELTSRIAEMEARLNKAAKAFTQLRNEVKA
jgi:hypothetical protein